MVLISDCLQFTSVDSVSVYSFCSHLVGCPKELGVTALRWLCLRLITSNKGGVKCVCPHLSVCLLTRLLKMRALIWMKCCVSTDVETWTNWLTFMPDPDYGPDAGTRLYKRCNAEFYYVGKIPCIRIGHPSLQRGMVLKWFYSRRAVGTPLSEVHALYRVLF